MNAKQTWLNFFFFIILFSKLVMKDENANVRKRMWPGRRMERMRKNEGEWVAMQRCASLNKENYTSIDETYSNRRRAVHCLGNKHKWQRAAQNIISGGHCTAVVFCTATKRHVQTSGSTGDIWWSNRTLKENTNIDWHHHTHINSLV